MKEFDEIDAMLEDVEEDEDDGGIITLHNETTGQDEDFYHIATLDYDKKWYVFLTPVKPTDDIAEDECLIYELGADENGDDFLAPILDEDLLQKVYERFQKEFEAYADDEEEA